MGISYSQYSILHQQFRGLSLPGLAFDSIFASIFLFHIPSLELVRVFNELCGALRAQGILLIFIPRGNNESCNG